MNETVAQVRFVLDNWIPFVITLAVILVPVTGAIYWAFNWRYQGVIERTRALWGLTEDDLKRSEQTTTELTKKLDKTESEIKQLRTELTGAYEQLKQPIPAAVDTLIDRAATSTSDARVQLDKLWRSNAAIRENVVQGIITSGGPDPFAECQQQLVELIPSEEPIKPNVRRIVEGYLVVGAKRRSPVKLRHWIRNARVQYGKTGRAAEVFDEVERVIELLAALKR
jgi:hypothetical protein